MSSQLRDNYKQRVQRQEALANFVEGTECGYCFKPMFSDQRLELDHITPVALGGMDGPTRLVHQACNSSAGARFGNQLRKNRGEWHLNGQALIGEPMSRYRNCVICGNCYHASHRTQLACGRVCGVELNRRNGVYDKPKVWVTKPRVRNDRPRKERVCVRCESTFVANGKAMHCASCYDFIGKEAKRLHAEGMGWKTIAKKFGFATPGGIYNVAARRYKSERVSLVVASS